MNSTPDPANVSPIRADSPASTDDRPTPSPPDRAASSSALPHGLIKTTVRGFRQGSSPERAGLGMLTSFAATISVSRVINYVRERRRRAPRLRSWYRRAYHLPGQEQLRVHHFVPGVALAFLAGGGAITNREDNWELGFSIPFGIGVGLTLADAGGSNLELMPALGAPWFG